MLIKSIKAEFTIIFNEWTIYGLILLLQLSFYLTNIQEVLFGISRLSSIVMTNLILKSGDNSVILQGLNMMCTSNSAITKIMRVFLFTNIPFVILLLLGFYIGYNDINKKIYKERALYYGTKVLYFSKVIVLYLICLLFSVIMILFVYINNKIEFNLVEKYGIPEEIIQITSIETVPLIVYILLISVIFFMRALFAMVIIIIFKNKYAVGIVLLFTIRNIIIIPENTTIGQLFIKMSKIEESYEIYIRNIYGNLFANKTTYSYFGGYFLNSEYNMTSSIQFFITQLLVILCLILLIGHIEEKKIGVR